MMKAFFVEIKIGYAGPWIEFDGVYLERKCGMFHKMTWVRSDCDST
jgi:hypothetical protein